MLKRLTKHGNSWAIIIDKPVLDLLKIEPETLREICTNGESILVRPATSAGRDERFAAALKKTNRKYGRTLKRLAE